MTWAIVLEIYREYGMKFEEAIDELNSRLADPGAPRKPKPPPRPQENDQSMAVLQAMMGGTDFRGPRG